MAYSREEIISQCSEAIQNISSFYKKGFVNYRGLTTDTKEYYGEIVAEFVLNHLDDFKRIKRITRESSYKVDSHDGLYTEGSNRIEETLAMQLFNQSQTGYIYKGIGKIIDYQTPLKNKSSNEAGKIDLLAVDDHTIYVLELKRKDSNETMLRCVLEGYTYMKMLNHEKLMCDFGLTGNRTFKSSPLVFYKSKQWQEMMEDRPKLKALMMILNANPFYLVEASGNFEVEEV